VNRRNFIGGLAACLAACSAPQLYAGPFKWKQSPSGVWVLNPEWISAPYEVSFYYFKKEAEILPVLFKRSLDYFPKEILTVDGKKFVLICDPHPPFRRDARGNWIPRIVEKRI